MHMKRREKYGIQCFSFHYCFPHLTLAWTRYPLSHVALPKRSFCMTWQPSGHCKRIHICHWVSISAFVIVTRISDSTCGCWCKTKVTGVAIRKVTGGACSSQISVIYLTWAFWVWGNHAVSPRFYYGDSRTGKW